MAAFASKIRMGAFALAAGAAALAAPAVAQPGYAANGYYAQPGYAEPGYAVDDLTVWAPRTYRRAPATGAPIRDVAISRVVYVADLDLNTAWGQDALERRVRQAARSACSEMNTFHPIATADSPPCESTAVQDALYRVRANYSGW